MFYLSEYLEEADEEYRERLLAITEEKDWPLIHIGGAMRFFEKGEKGDRGKSFFVFGRENFEKDMNAYIRQGRTS